MNAIAPSKADRLQAFRSANWEERTAMHDAIAAHKRDAITIRRALGRRYLEEHPAGPIVEYDRAVLFADMRERTAPAREEAIALADGRAAQHNSGSLEYPVLGQNFREDSEAVKLMTSPEILSPIIRYCGMLPVLFNMFVTRAHKTEFVSNSAHMFHLDPEDVISFKIFVHLTDVDDDSGPFHCLPAGLTQEVFKTVEYRGIGRITDEEIAGLVGWDKVVKVTGPAGTVAYADTTRCLHFGGRPRKDGKPVRDMLVAQYLLPTSFLFPVDGDAKHPNFLPTLKPTGDDHWNALIGAKYT